MKRRARWISGIYDLAVARSGRAVLPRREQGRHHNTARIPDALVLEIRRAHEQAEHGQKKIAVRAVAEKHGLIFLTAWNIAHYNSRSGPDRPLDPSLQEPPMRARRAGSA